MAISKKIVVGNVAFVPQTVDFGEGRWEKTLVVPRFLAKNNLVRIWEQFAEECCTHGPGREFIRKASFYRNEEGDFVFVQNGGLDI